MRVVLSTYGSRGDVQPLMGLGVSLRDLGVGVQVCAPPDAEFARVMADIGVPLVPVGLPARYLTIAAPPPSSIPHHAAELIADQFQAVGAAAEGCDAVVATGMLPAAAGALSVAEMLGVPAVSVTFQKLSLPCPHHPPMAYPGHPFPPDIRDNRRLWELDAQAINALFGEALNSNRTAHGLPPVHNVRDYVFGEQPWLATDPVLDPWLPIPELDVVQTGTWNLSDDRPLPPGLAEFLQAGSAPVYVGFGSMPMHSSTDPARAAIDAVRTLGCRVVVRCGWAELAAIDDRDDCFFVDEVNHQALFRRVAAVVHHGGAGTTTTAAQTGTPQVVVPQATDQPYWAGRVADLGIGAAHDGPTPTANSLAAALRTATSPEVRTRAADVAKRIRTDGAAVAAQLLIERVLRDG